MLSVCSTQYKSVLDALRGVADDPRVRLIATATPEGVRRLEHPLVVGDEVAQVRSELLRGRQVDGVQLDIQAATLVTLFTAAVPESGMFG